MTKTVYTDQTELNCVNGDWLIVEFDGTTEQLSKVADIEKVFRIKDLAFSMRFCGCMNLNGKIYDLRDTEDYFYNTPVILELAPGSYIPKHENTDLFVVMTSDPHFIQKMPTLPDGCKYIRAFHLANKTACLFEKSGYRLMDVTKLCTYEMKENTMAINLCFDCKAVYYEEDETNDFPRKSNIPGMRMQLMDDEVLQFAKDVCENFKYNGDNIQGIQLREPALTKFKELAKRYVKEHERRTL